MYSVCAEASILLGTPNVTGKGIVAPQHSLEDRMPVCTRVQRAGGQTGDSSPQTYS